MGVTLESEIQQDRSMALVWTDETKTDRLERIIRDHGAWFGHYGSAL